MFVTEEIHPKEKIEDQLDYYLSKGFFRGGQRLYRTKLLFHDDDIHTTIRVRLPLKNYQFKKRLRKRLNKNNRLFTSTIRKARYSKVKNGLYQQTKHRFAGFVANDIYEAINLSEKNLYNTRECCIYDGNKMVGVSFFDIGRNAMASLSCFYHNDYTSFSIGMYSMLLEIQHAQELGMAYYYPGYVTPSHPAFAYKLRLGNYQYYQPETNNWLPYSQLNTNNIPSSIIKRQLKELQTVLLHRGIVADYCLYPNYEYGQRFFKMPSLAEPVFLSCQYNDYEYLIISFDPLTYSYKLIACETIKIHPLFLPPPYPSKQTNLYFNNILMVNDLLYQTADVQTAALAVIRLMLTK